MVKAIVKCAECGKEEEYELNPQFPRKYCSECSEKKRAEFKAKQAGTTQEPTTQAHTEPQSQLLSIKDINIMAQTFTKCYYYGNKAEKTSDILDVFNCFVKALENNA